MIFTPQNSTNPNLWGREIKFILDGKDLDDEWVEYEWHSYEALRKAQNNIIDFGQKFYGANWKYFKEYFKRIINS